MEMVFMAEIIPIMKKMFELLKMVCPSPLKANPMFQPIQIFKTPMKCLKKCI